MEGYILKSGIILASFYAIYWMLVRHHYRFNSNRIIILFSVLVSAILPVLSFDLIQSGIYPMVQTLEPIIISSIDNPMNFNASSNSYSIFSIVYIMGLVVVSIRSLAGVATLVYLYWRFPKKNYHGFKAVIIQGNQSPFTFFNILFINANDFKKDKVDELIAHEEVHRNQFHSIDLILMEILTVIHWFNPFIWLFKHDLKSEHEFKADEKVIEKGFDTTRYQKLLLQSNEGIALYLANNFNYSILKKRLKMMNNKRSNRAMELKYLIAAPTLLIGTMVLFLNFQLNDQIQGNVDILPVYKTGTDALYKTLQKNILYPKEAREENVQGKVFVSFTVNKKGEIEQIKAEDSKYNLIQEMVVVGYSEKNTPAEIKNDLSIIQKECERVIALLDDFNPGQKDGKPVDTKMTIPVTFKLGQRD